MSRPYNPAWIVIAAVLAGHTVVSLTVPRGYATAAFGNILQSILLALLFAVTLLNSRSSEGRVRWFWLSMAAGAGLWLAATLMWAWFEVVLRRVVPVPFVGDVLFFVHIVPMMGALALRPHRSERQQSIDFGGLDFLLLLLWWVYLYLVIVIPWQYVSPEVGQYSYTFNLLYIGEHAVFLGVLASLYLRTRGGWRRIYGGLLAAGTVYAVGSQICNFEITTDKYFTGSVYDLPLVASMLMFISVSLEARAPAPRPMGRPGSRIQGVIASRLAMLATISLPFMAIWAGLTHTSPEVCSFRRFVTIGALVILPVLVFLKQHLLDRRLMHLWRDSQHNFENLKRLQRQLVQAEKLAALGQLVSGAAHEINNPLTAIMGYSDLLADDPAVPAEKRAFVTKIGQQARRVREVVANLRHHAKRIPGEKVLVDLNTVVANAVELRTLDLRENIRIEQQLAPDLPPILADADALLQVCFHIIGNAVEALQQVPAGRLQIHSRRDGNAIELEFSDNGPGIQDPQRIFDPFYSTKPAGRSVGLGLSACYGIVQDHQGQIVCANRPEGGAKFTITLPLLQPERATAAATTA